MSLQKEGCATLIYSRTGQRVHSCETLNSRTPNYGNKKNLTPGLSARPHGCTSNIQTVTQADSDVTVAAVLATATEPVEPDSPPTFSASQESSAGNETPAATQPTAILTPSGPQLSASGPWLVYAQISQFMARDSDGETVIPLAAGLDFSISGRDAPEITILPAQGAPFAAVVSLENVNDLADGASLYIVELPIGTVKFVSHLFIPELGGNHHGQAFNQELRSALLAAPQWSPDGTRLAFIAAVSSASPDLYVYDTLSGLLHRITNSGGIADIHWSPLGTHVLFGGAYWLGPIIDGRGIVLATGGADPQIHALGAGQFLTWTGPTTYAVYNWTQGRGNHYLRQIDISDGTTTPFWSNTFSSAAFDPLLNNLAVCLSAGEASVQGQSNAGLYLIRADGTVYTQVDSECQGFLESSPHLDGFVLYTQPPQLIDRAGQSIELAEPYDSTIELSPNGLWRTRSSASSAGGVWLAGLEGIWLKYHEGPISELLWSPDSLRFYFIDGGRQLFRMTLGDPGPELIDQNVRSAGWVLP